MKKNGVLPSAIHFASCGAHGMTAGRNIWGAENPGKMVAALKAVIHGGESPEIAAKLLD